MPKKTIKKASFSINEYSLSEEEAIELGKCYQSPQYFIHNYCYIYDAADGSWVHFRLWPAQVAALKLIEENQLTVILKSRQIGLTWLVLAYGLWRMIFRPIASISIFSKRDIDAIYLLSEDRLRGMFDRLPEWLKEGHSVNTDNAHEWSMENESTARSFPTSAGDSYTSTLAIVDEADLSPDLNSLLRAVKPTIDNGGKMILLSRADKDKPISDFKTIYIDAKKGINGWAPIFLPWWSHPIRTEQWYELQKIDIKSRTGSYDDLYEQYPATDIEALNPRSTDKRIPYEWLQTCYEEIDGDDKVGLPGLIIYKRPTDNGRYIIGADPAEGNPNSDDSSACIIDLQTGEEMATLAGKLQPDTFADYLMKLSRFFNDAMVLCERNNHGHAILSNFNLTGFEFCQNGYDDKPGWVNNVRGKALMYTHCTNLIQESAKEKQVMLHSPVTISQLASIVGNTLKAPDHMHDDAATAFALAQCGRKMELEGNAAMNSVSITSRSETALTPIQNFGPSKVKRAPARESFHSRVHVIKKSTRVRDVVSRNL